jgi:hypothetical protein
VGIALRHRHQHIAPAIRELPPLELRILVSTIG